MKRDPLIDQILNQMKQGLNEAGVLRSLKRPNKAITLTEAGGFRGKAGSLLKVNVISMAK